MIPRYGQNCINILYHKFDLFFLNVGLTNIYIQHTNLVIILKKNILVSQHIK